MPYMDRMPIKRFNRQQIQPTEHRSWDDARRYFKARPKHWAGVEKYVEEIRRGGIRQPIQLIVHDRYRDVYVGDGHHRVVAALEAQARHIPFHWGWQHAFGGVRMENSPIPDDLLGH